MFSIQSMTGLLASSIRSGVALSRYPSRSPTRSLQSFGQSRQPELLETLHTLLPVYRFSFLFASYKRTQMFQLRPVLNDHSVATTWWNSLRSGTLQCRRTAWKSARKPLQKEAAATRLKETRLFWWSLGKQRRFNQFRRISPFIRSLGSETTL